MFLFVDGKKQQRMRAFLEFLMLGRTTVRCISAGFHKVDGEKMYIATFLSTGLPMKSTLSLDMEGKIDNVRFTGIFHI